MGLLDLMRVMSIQRQQDQERRRRQAQTQAFGEYPPPLLISFLPSPDLPLCMPKPSGSGLSQADLSLTGNKKDLIAAPDVPLSLFSWVDVYFRAD